MDTRKLLKEIGLFLADILYNAIVIVILVVLIRSFLISPFRVIGSSMADTLHNKEFILIDKLSYTIGDIDRGDPIVFLPPATSKDTPKFEETVAMDEEGVGRFEFEELVTQKRKPYCDEGILQHSFLCREKVNESDLVYYAPVRQVSTTAHETDWSAVQVLQLDAEMVKQGYVALSGDSGRDYTVRVYDSEGVDYFVKRVIGIPGDTVKIENGRVYIKKAGTDEFMQIEEPFLNEENLNRTYISQRQRQNIYEVPEDSYFVLGDNRNHSNDSRSWLEPITQNAYPFVPESNISGRVLVVLWPITGARFVSGADF